MRQSRKLLCVVRRTEGSNPSPSADRARSRMATGSTSSSGRKRCRPLNRKGPPARASDCGRIASPDQLPPVLEGLHADERPATSRSRQERRSAGDSNSSREQPRPAQVATGCGTSPLHAPHPPHCPAVAQRWETLGADSVSDCARGTSLCVLRRGLGHRHLAGLLAEATEIQRG